eukprot:scaffold73540_cov56-Phaeocystis_antarctica.AAC.3
MVSREWKVPECGNAVRNEVRRGARSRARDAQAACGQRTAVDDVDDSDRAREDGGSGGRVDDEGEVVEEPKQEEGGYRAPRWASRDSIQHGATQLAQGG